MGKRSTKNNKSATKFAQKAKFSKVFGGPASGTAGGSFRGVQEFADVFSTHCTPSRTGAADLLKAARGRITAAPGNCAILYWAVEEDYRSNVKTIKKDWSGGSKSNGQTIDKEVNR